MLVLKYAVLNVAHNYGKSATIGIENPAGTAGVQFSHNEISLEDYHGQKGIRFRPLSNGGWFSPF